MIFGGWSIVSLAGGLLAAAFYQYLRRDELVWRVSDGMERLRKRIGRV